jgi:alpha/beta superfamily hydrolase
MVQELVDDAIQNRAREILASIPGISAGAEVLSNVAKRRIELRLQQALANPAQAREILRNAPAEDLPILQAALQQTGATTSTLSTIEGQ